MHAALWAAHRTRRAANRLIRPGAASLVDSAHHIMPVASQQTLNACTALVCLAADDVKMCIMQYRTCAHAHAAALVAILMNMPGCCHLHKDSSDSASTCVQVYRGRLWGTAGPRAWTLEARTRPQHAEAALQRQQAARV